MSDVLVDVSVEFCREDGRPVATAWMQSAFRLAVVPRVGELVNADFLADLIVDVPWEVPFDWVPVSAVRHIPGDAEEPPSVELVFRLPVVSSMAQLQGMKDAGWRAAFNLPK